MCLNAFICISLEYFHFWSTIFITSLSFLFYELIVCILNPTAYIQSTIDDSTFDEDSFEYIDEF